MMNCVHRGYMAIDQHGQTYHIGDNAPRKWLLNRFWRQHAEKMYRNNATGRTRHVGYIIAGLWMEIFRVCQWKKAGE